MTKLIFGAILLLCFGIATIEAMRKQGVAVKGKLVCGQYAALNNTKVRIVDIDTGPDPDDTLDEKFIDADGTFKLNGYTRELTDIDPVIYIWHDCMDLENPCQRKVKLTLPKKYIISGEPEEKDWINIGTINLEGSFDDEKRECIQ
uniref:Transthyretin-like family protein n=1 Tax=Parastrongyloides trichosuri TaxID=131310 RepID=A0A0N4ZB55_PARTI